MPDPTQKERVTIVGDGAMATVCSILLTQGGHEVTMWGAFEESIERLIQNREQNRLLRDVWKRLKPHLPDDVPIVSVAKGIENGTLLRPTQVIADVAGGLRPLAALS